MTNPNYHQWPAEIQDEYDKTAKKIEKYGLTVYGNWVMVAWKRLMLMFGDCDD